MSLFHAIEKQSLRRAALDRRATLGAVVRAAAATAVVAPGLDLAARFAAAAPIALFAALPDELDTTPLMAALAAAGHDLALPAVVDPAGALVFRHWCVGDPMVPGAKGILEPAADCPVVVPHLLFVPFVAFDRRGFRIGYGAGYYDRTLADLKRNPATVAVGLGFAAQEVFKVPELAHDVRLDAVLTERETIECRSRT